MMFETLHRGDRSVYVQYAALALSRAGYETKISSDFDDRMYRAAVAFQNDNGSAADGIIGADTWSALRPYLVGYRIIKAESGDTIENIAARYGTDAAAIITANPDIGEDIAGEFVTVPLSFDVVPANVDYTSALTALVTDGITARYPFVEASSAGNSVIGTPIGVMKIGTGNTEVFFNASHHANEWITTPLVLRFAESYAKAYAFGGGISGKSAAQLYDSRTLYIMPLVNPDGVDLVNGGINDNFFVNLTRGISAGYPFIPYPSGWKANILGTDPNLNYPAGWVNARAIKFERGFVSPAPRDFVGTAPLSAPESRAAYEFTLEHSFALTISYHTQGEVIYWKYLDYEPERSRAIAEELSRVSGYETQTTPSESGYAGYKDWFISYYNLPGYTVEAGRGENPLPLEQFDTIYAANEPLMATAMELASELSI